MAGLTNAEPRRTPVTDEQPQPLSSLFVIVADGVITKAQPTEGDRK